MDTQQIVLTSRPNGMPDKNNFRFEKITLPELQEDEVLIKGIYYSVDPYMRGRMNATKSYVPPYQINEVIIGGIIGEVLQSKSKEYKEGDIITGRLPWAKQSIVSTKSITKIDSQSAPISYYLGILGMPGLTAYFGLMDICKPKAGETIVISGAAGAVGITVGQIAKIQGCRVIGIAGGNSKIKILKDEFGFDEVINYKTSKNIKTAIAKVCPNGVDMYYDNVGGEISDAVIANINFHARIALCGQISLYNVKEIPTGPRLQPILLTRSVLMQGFIVSNYQDHFPEGIKQLSQWIKENKLKYKETIINGFDKLPEALLALFTGGNTGKMIVKA